jgi:hypothetical protein
MDRWDRTPPPRQLTRRWTNVAAARFENIVSHVTRKGLNSSSTICSMIGDLLEEHEASRGELPAAMVHAGVCRAVLEDRAEYIAELLDSNPPELS